MFPPIPNDPPFPPEFPIEGSGSGKINVLAPTPNELSLFPRIFRNDSGPAIFSVVAPVPTELATGTCAWIPKLGSGAGATNSLKDAPNPD